MTLVDRIITSALEKRPNCNELYKKTLLINSFKQLVHEHPVQYASKVGRNCKEVEALLERLIDQDLTTYSNVVKDMNTKGLKY